MWPPGKSLEHGRRLLLSMPVMVTTVSIQSLQVNGRLSKNTRLQLQGEEEVWSHHTYNHFHK